MDYVKIVCEITATILCLIGVTYGAIPRRIALWYLIVGTIIWMIFAVCAQHWFFLTQEIFLLIINIVCLKTWKDQGIRF